MSIETVKKDLREMMKLTRKQVLLSTGKIEFTPVIATDGDDKWGSLCGTVRWVSLYLRRRIFVNRHSISKRASIYGMAH